MLAIMCVVFGFGGCAVTIGAPQYIMMDDTDPNCKYVRVALLC